MTEKDLPVWQALHEELAPEGLAVITVAIDRSIDDPRPFIEAAGVTLVLSFLAMAIAIPLGLFLAEKRETARASASAVGAPASSRIDAMRRAEPVE